MTNFDVIVIGGGHAGTEAAAAAARMGARCLLLTHRLDRVGEMSCNPSIGGIGKGHLVREVDALDGIMGRAADLAGIHFKLLNRSKGPAVRGLRAQADRGLYRAAVQRLLHEQPGLEIRADAVEDFWLDRSGAFAGVQTASGARISAGACVLTTGTFLHGVIHVGHAQSPAGRVGEAPSIRLAETLGRLGLPLGRLKTGTPPRLARDSIDWDGLPADQGDKAPAPFSFMTDWIDTPQIECRVTGTTTTTHAVIRENLHRSAMYGGAISGRGPRYCPSIEDKVVRFAERERHQIFLEPEGLPGGEDGAVVYPNGISTSLPADAQAAMIASIPGLEHARIIRLGYAVEYDFVDPQALDPSLALRAVPGVFLAGQINGTTGYEEAAAQGVLAGLNAARLADGGTPVILDRASSYIGVMVDDLTTRGVTEPYRMFTSRAEFRLSLRCDNADLRLTPIGLAAGCVGSARAARFAAFQAETEAALVLAREDVKSPQVLGQFGVGVKQDGQPRGVLDVLGRAFDPESVFAAFPWFAGLSVAAQCQLEVEALYHGYLARQASEVRQLRATEAVIAAGRTRLCRCEWAERRGAGKAIRSPPALPGCIGPDTRHKPANRDGGAWPYAPYPGVSVSRETPDFDVSRETSERLEVFANLLLRWNTRINLISRADAQQLRGRHIADSLQLADLMPEGIARAIDLGSGAGFPGLILAIATGVHFDLVESDQRKAAFLREAIRLTAAPAQVHACRIEALALAPAPLVTARALAPLAPLLGLATPLLASGRRLLVSEGRKR